jgi:16S rRNA (cytosine967-C5)-methyltransferase
MARASEKISSARKAAFEILLAVERSRGHSDDLLRGRAVSRLAAQDRNLATALVLGTLRWQLALDARIRPLLKRPNAKLDAEVLIALRLGAFQLLHLDRIPAHAAIGESVELALSAGHRFASGMVNAVLRKLAASCAKTGENDACAAYPVWMMERWESFFGSEIANAICSHGVSEPDTSIRVAGAEAEAELAQNGITIAPSRLLSAARTVLSGDVTATDAFRSGRVRIQDEGSQLVAEIAGQGNTILDACAAPGGKTLILAERNPQSRIVACEINPKRFAALQERLAFLGERVECRQADAATIADNFAYDLVLVDVPCSGTGTLARNPEIRHRLELTELSRQAAQQSAILAAALRAAQPGGHIVYSTCSLEPEENEEVVAAVLADHPTARIVPLAERIRQMSAEGILEAGGEEKLAQSLTPEGFLRLFPGVFGTDGFFVALIEKPA